MKDRLQHRRGGPREHPLLRDAAVGRPHAREFRQRARRAVSRAAVRVLGRLRRVRRDALSQAHVAALRRPAADRERHGLLVDLRREPADDAVGRERRRPRAGVGQLALRGQRRVRPRLPPRHRQPDRAGASPCTETRAAHRRRPGDGDPAGAAGHRVGLPRAAPARGRAEGQARGRDGRGRGQSARRRGLPRAATVWIVGGDGWAYDIDYGGLDHVLASGKDVNILVLDTEVYSNTGGQASKATPLGASAKFAAAGKTTPRKDLAMMAIAYGNVYVAQIAMGANTSRPSWPCARRRPTPAPSLILAYSQCIAHGTDMRHGMKQAARAVASGYWPLFRYDPTMRATGHEPVPARLAAAAHPARGIPLQRSALQVADANASRRRQADARPGAASPRGTVSDVRGSCVARRKPLPPALAGRLIMNLATRYLGLQLAHPIVASASPLSSTVDGMRRLEDAGAAAVVMASLYEEQIRAEDTAYALYTELGSNSQAEAGSYFPELADYDCGISGYLETLRRASDGARHPGDRQSQRHDCRGMDRARARPRTGRRRGDRAEHLLDPDRSRGQRRRTGTPLRGDRPPGQIDRTDSDLRQARPLLHVASAPGRGARGAGADGLVLFNRFYAPDIDLRRCE